MPVAGAPAGACGLAAGLAVAVGLGDCANANPKVIAKAIINVPMPINVFVTISFITSFFLKIHLILSL